MSAPALEGVTLIAAHDAGGAEVVSSYVRRHPGAYLFSLQGPALKVFESKLGAIDVVPLAVGLQRCDGLLCGTSWQSDLEVTAIAACRARGVPSRAFLDHWVNYRERFERGALFAPPDEIWVGDPIALRLAAERLPGIALRLLDNPYFADVRVALQAYEGARASGEGLSVLYVCEPVREHALLRFGNARHWGYTEEEALQYFLENIRVLGAPVARITIRPHPSEARDKYAAFAGWSSLPIVFSDGAPLYAEIAASDWVVGCSSMAMVVGLIGGKHVLSCIPPGGHPCSLPQAEIMHLQELAARA